jgi:uncharacterized membrane protein
MHLLINSPVFITGSLTSTLLLGSLYQPVEYAKNQHDDSTSVSQIRDWLPSSSVAKFPEAVSSVHIVALKTLMSVACFQQVCP